jgi:uncharacterized membrane-anchored protein YhcB (DUF1043 family)
VIAWEWLIPVLLLGLAGGFVLGWSGSGPARHSKKLDRELRDTRDELVRYRDQVAAHFSTTADLMNAMTANYAAIHRHLVQGAHELCTAQEPRFKTISVHEPGIGETVPAQKSLPLTVPPLHLPEEKAGDFSRPASSPHTRGWYNETTPDAEVTDYVKEDPRY